MTCKNKDIKALFPTYLEGVIAPSEREPIETHLASCKDCRAEIQILRMMAEEQVPDPGESFWTEMPNRIYRVVRQQQQKKTFAAPPVLGGLFSPRWAWAMAAVAVIAATGLFLLRPAPVEMTAKAPTSEEAAYDDVLSAEPMDIADLGAQELDAVTAWADQELAAVSDDMTNYMTDNNVDVDDELANLDAKQLERLSKMLDAWKREV